MTPIRTEVENLLGASVIRGYAGRGGIASVVRVKNGIVLKFAEQTQLDVRKISALCAMNKQALYRRSTPPAILFQVNRSGGYRELLQFLDQIRHCISAVNTV